MRLLRLASRVEVLSNEVRLLNMQIKQLLPVFEVTNNMTDRSIFNLIEFIWTQIYDSYLPNVLDDKITRSTLEYEIEKYLSKEEAKRYDEEIKSLTKTSQDLANDLARKQKSIVELENQLVLNRDETEKKAGKLELTALQFQIDSTTASKHDMQSISRQLDDMATRDEVKETNDLIYRLTDKIDKSYYNKAEIDSIQNRILGLVRNDLNTEHSEVSKHINEQIIKIDTKLNDHYRTMGKFKDIQNTHEKQINEISKGLKTKASINELLATDK